MSIEDEALHEALFALSAAEKQFTTYAEHHHAKGATDKSATNYGFATLCGKAKEKMRLVYPGLVI